MASKSWAMVTSGPAATNIVTPLADAYMDSVPLVVITGQVPYAAIGTDAFQETPIVEVCRGITKHHYLVTDVNDLPRIMKEAFHVATTGRPGPVLVDVPKDIGQGPCAAPFTDELDRLLDEFDRAESPRPEVVDRIGA